MRHKAIPDYLLHRPSGQARVRINGRDHYLGLYDSAESKAKYQELVKRTLADRVKAEMDVQGML
jgi:hypothetical protein